jgi:hypothetical protein
MKKKHGGERRYPGLYQDRKLHRKIKSTHRTPAAGGSNKLVVRAQTGTGALTASKINVPDGLRLSKVGELD